MSGLTDQDRRTVATHLMAVLGEHPVTKMMRGEAIKELAYDLAERLDRHGWIAYSADTAERPPALNPEQERIAAEQTTTRLALYRLAGAVMAHAGRHPCDPELVDSCADVQRRLRKPNT